MFVVKSLSTQNLPCTNCPPIVAVNALPNELSFPPSPISSRIRFRLSFSIRSILQYAPIRPLSYIASPLRAMPVRCSINLRPIMSYFMTVSAVAGIVLKFSNSFGAARGIVLQLSNSFCNATDQVDAQFMVQIACERLQSRARAKVLRHHQSWQILRRPRML